MIISFCRKSVFLKLLKDDAFTTSSGKDYVKRVCLFKKVPNESFQS